ncbi:DUF3466 family protein [Vibrio alfacsensis]|uniref:DUF3466 family protein n=1 Tax=Vibrio alfacsensis TaxID=1074311 RepID=UPI0040685CCD
MNCSNKFKLTAVAMMVGTAMNANAALYQVVEVQPDAIDTTDKAVFGVAIQAGNVFEDTDQTMPYKLGCFDNGAGCNEDTFALAGETRPTKLSDGRTLPSLLAGKSIDGVNFREEAPFASDPRFRSLEDYDELESYCFFNLGYETCESWASSVWAPLNQVRYTLNTDSVALAFVEGQTFDNQYNNVINALDENVVPIGNQSVLNTEANTLSEKLKTGNQAIAPGEQPKFEKLNPEDTRTAYAQVRAWSSDSKTGLISGSVSYAQSNDYGNNYASKAAIWDQNGNVSQINWPSGKIIEDDRLAQGSLRDFVVSEAGDSIYAVGFNTWDSDRNYLDATVYKGKFSTPGVIETLTWEPPKQVLGARSDDGSDYIFTNTVIEAINKNKLAVGESKLNTPENGAQANRLFVIKDIESPSATYLSGDIFFPGAGGEIGGLNNYNEIVGQIDAENTREDGGKARRKRGFINPYDFTGTDPDRRAIFDNQAWLLDNLTNDGDATGNNNQFRIVDATDINDAGVISATATMCEGGYDTTAHNSLCKGGEANAEKVVAVKLIPLANKTAEDIVKRPVEQTAAERQGAGLGLWALTLMGLFGFRRK